MTTDIDQKNKIFNRASEFGEAVMAIMYEAIADGITTKHAVASGPLIDSGTALLVQIYGLDRDEDLVATKQPVPFHTAMFDGQINSIPQASCLADTVGAYLLYLAQVFDEGEVDKGLRVHIGNLQATLTTEGNPDKGHPYLVVDYKPQDDGSEEVTNSDRLADAMDDAAARRSSGSHPARRQRIRI